MKLNGKKVDPPKSIIIPIPRDDGDLFFHCAPVLDYKPFETLCPEPKVPVIQNIKTKAWSPDPDDAVYKQQIEKHSMMRVNWLMIQSISGTPGLEWEQVKLDDPNTWELYEKELLESLTPNELQLVNIGVFNANMPTKERQDEALKRFHASQAPEAVQK